MALVDRLFTVITIPVKEYSNRDTEWVVSMVLHVLLAHCCKIVQLHNVVTLSLKQPVSVAFLCRIGLQEGQDVLSDIFDHLWLEFRVLQIRDFFSFDQFVILQWKSLYFS